MSYTNGSIYQHKISGDSLGLVLVFSAFTNEESILAVPVLDKPTSSSVPLLLGATLSHISVCEMFRVKKEDMMSAVAEVDANSIETVVQSLHSALLGHPKTVSIPTAVMLPNSTLDAIPATDMAENLIPSSSQKPKARPRYTIDDYRFILKNYHDNIADIMRRYELRDRQAVYRVKHALSKRFGEIAATEPTKQTGEAASGE
jgi:hypothetical protein